MSYGVSARNFIFFGNPNRIFSGFLGQATVQWNVWGQLLWALWNNILVYRKLMINNIIFIWYLYGMQILTIKPTMTSKCVTNPGQLVLWFILYAILRGITTGRLKYKLTVNWAALGPCRQNVVETINSVSPSSYSLKSR
jgi:hypothetical protein